MVIRAIRFAPYSIPLREPLRTSRGEIGSREGFLIALENQEGRISVGEAAPLPGFGTETLAEAHETLLKLAAARSLPKLPETPQALTEWTASLGLSLDKTPATVFGLESALLGLLPSLHTTQSEGIPQKKLPVNALIGNGPLKSILQTAQRFAEEGYNTLKLKVGVKSLADDAQTVRTLRDELPDTALRLDANGVWDLDTAKRFCREIETCGVEYIEDPLRVMSCDNLKKLRAAACIPLAVDTAEVSPNDIHYILNECCCDVVVIKPMVMGSIERIREISDLAHQQKIRVVFSSLIETSTGLAHIAMLAAVFGTPQTAHGLGTAPLLTDDTVTSPLIPTRGFIPMPELQNTFSSLKDPYRIRLAGAV